MEQQKAATKTKSKILKFLPRAASSSVSFQNPPLYSPNKDKRSSEKTHKSNLGLGFSGPMVSIIPSDRRRKNKNDSTYTLVYEPTSPRVSCMGQVKCKHYRNKLAAADGVANKPPSTHAKPTKKVSKTMSFTVGRTRNKEDDQENSEKVDPVVKNKKKLGIRSIFRGGASSNGRKSDATNNKSKTACNLPRAPSMGTMKRFSSGRDAFKNFDWTTQVAPLNFANRNYFTDDERDGGSDGEGDEDIKIPSSAPVIVRNEGICDKFVRGGGIILEPKKEINLWKRRTMPQPTPLQVHVA